MVVFALPCGAGGRSRFSSNLPGGSAQGRRGGSKGGGYCILDCVFHELDQTFFVLDMMAWKVNRPVFLLAQTLAYCSLWDANSRRMATVGTPFQPRYCSEYTPKSKGFDFQNM